MLAACIGVFPSVEPPNLLRSFSASVSLPLPFRQPSSGIQRLCCIKLALLLHIFLGFFKRMENAHRHTLVPYFGFRYKLTKVYSLCLLCIFLTLFFLVLRNVRIFVLRRQVLRTAGKATSLFRITRRQYEDAAALTFGLSFYSFLRIVTLFCRHSQSQHRHYFAFHALLGAAC